ncbi:hypothetical protein FB45DRAFT_1036758 [Roridomyces roridus]|uniref:Uncharacterized protein n=1 Tax=Roridomyces roridus TaxID=1738132 RepID=A0AAD7B7J9_9AGAR|nr:hypothetical protein FB45DRAFT_1036758 [Roridomyces roridus]
MFPPELVELIILEGWLTLSTSSHRHTYSMTRWMMVSREWLSIVVPIFLRDVWATNLCVMFHIEDATSRDYPGIAYKLAGIPDVRKYLSQNCRSLTVSVYQRRTGEYDRQCTELAEEPYYGIPLNMPRNAIMDWLPNITSLHFLLVDCLPTYWFWDMEYDINVELDELKRQRNWSVLERLQRFNSDRITDVHFTFAYTSPPPPALISAPFPKFDVVKRLVVREANADFVAFLATKFPQLECIESTAAFGAQDLPPKVADRVGDRMVFRRLAPTTEWGITGSDLNVPPDRIGVPRVFTQLGAPTPDLASSDSDVRPKDDPPPATTADSTPDTKENSASVSTTDAPLAPTASASPAPKVNSPERIAKEDSNSPLAPEKKKASLWSVVKRVFRKRKYPMK